MKFRWVKSAIIYAAFMISFISHANLLNWGEDCSDIYIDQWLAHCAMAENLQSCLSNAAGLIPQSDAAVLAAQTINHRDFFKDISEHQYSEALASAMWETLSGCSDYDTGTGSFERLIRFTDDSIFPVGSIPVAKAQVKIKLKAMFDVDLQLYDGSTALINKQGGLLSGANQQSIDYQGMHITYSGYAGDDSSGGNETIDISGITSTALRLQLLGHQAGEVAIEYQWGINPLLGAIAVPNRDVFNHLSGRSAVPGAIGIREMKFLIKDINSEYPSLYFIHSDNVPLHIDFAYDVLNWYPDLTFNQANRAFNSSTYFLDERKHLAGSILAHDSFINQNTHDKGLYTLQLWPTDPVTAHLIVKTHKLIKSQMKLAEDNLAYFPASDTHTTIYQDNIDFFTTNQVAVIDSETLFANVTYAAMNLGEGFGTLRVVGEGDPIPSVNDIAIFTFIPNDLAHVAGIITDTPQTPLSHINLKAKQNNTPNAFIQNAATNPIIAPLLNQLVHYQVTHDGFVLTAASQAQVDAWLESVRPIETQIPISDLSISEPARLDTLRHPDWISFGAKAANVAELAYVLEPGSFPVGYAIPFSMYDQFMRLNRCQGFEEDGVTLDGKYRKLCVDPVDPSGKSLYQQIEAIMTDESFINSPDDRSEQLDAFRKQVRKSEVPAEMSEIIASIRYFWDPDGDFSHSIRLRSSTNNEDLSGFNGAGLYESNTHHPDEGDMAESVKKVWASLWTARAFEERRFYRIDHFKTYMGVLVHLSYGDEQANGVAVTKNIYDRNWEGYYVNVQYGEISVTNPEPIITDDGEVGSIPDEFLLTRLVASATDYQWIQQFIRHSNVTTVYGEPVPTINVLTDSEVVELREAMKQIQAHFKTVYAGDENFAMDIEFKITRTDDGSRGHLEIKQARPWID